MNINTLISRFFGNSEPSIEVFDEKNIYAVYARLQETLRDMPDIELSVLQALAYCFYEIMDNVLIHSDKSCGTVLMKYFPQEKRIRVLVADDGIGIRASLSKNPRFSGISEKDALRSCIEDRVTSGNGMGFGLYSTARLVKNAGTRLLIHSGSHLLCCEGENIAVDEVPDWEGTLVFLELLSDKEINPDLVVDHRTDVKTEYNEAFLQGKDDFDTLW